MRMSALVSTISTKSMVDRKNAHSAYISRSSGSTPAAAAAVSALPMPSQAGSTDRACVQAKIQGMARMEAMSRLPVARRVGRLPMLRLPSSSSGVAWR